LLLGGRGPIFFFILVYSFFLLFHGKIKLSFRRNTLFYAIITLSALIVLIIIFREEFARLTSHTFARIKLIITGFGSTNNDYGNSVNERLEFLNQSKEIILDSFRNFLFGAGIGSFGILTTGEDIRHYPHNFILEIWCEIGLIGVTIFLSMIIVSLHKIRISKNSINIFPIVYILLSYLKSGGLEDMRLLFTFLAIYIVASNHKVSLE
jgi:O-antigen ligase